MDADGTRVVVAKTWKDYTEPRAFLGLDPGELAPVYSATAATSATLARAW
jgi:hypothetical protein